MSSVGVLANPDSPNQVVVKSAQAAAQKAGLIVVPVQARNLQEIENAFATLSRDRVGGVVVVPDAGFFTDRQRIAELALRNRLPSIFSEREYVAAGGLMSYGESLADFYRRAASYVDKIFKGAKPADLPIEQPTRFYLVFNLKTAKALGLEIPPTLLATTDEVIE